jgi:hypothetical protein
MPSLLSSIFNRPCPHQFSWPQCRSEGGHYQVCIRCGDRYVYDWETLARVEKITASVQSRAPAPKPSGQVPRTQRFTLRKPIFYRQVNQSQYHLAILLNISASGLLLECHTSIPEGTDLEMILEMPQEITGQPERRVLCRGEVARSAFAKSGTPLVGVSISGYCFLRGRSIALRIGETIALYRV